MIHSLKSKGWHLSLERKELLNHLINRINRHRLTTNLDSLISTVPLDLDLKISKLLEESNFEIHPNGKIFIKSSQTYLRGRGNTTIDVFSDKDDYLFSLDSVKETAIHFQTSERTIQRRLDSGEALPKNNLLFIVKRKQGNLLD